MHKYMPGLNLRARLLVLERLKLDCLDAHDVVSRGTSDGKIGNEGKPDEGIERRMREKKQKFWS